MIQRLRSLDVAEPFNTPVSGIPGYCEIVKVPMDLGTLQSNMESHEYSGPLEYLSDMRRIFYNALVFNRRGDSVHFMALVMLAVFEGDWNRTCTRLSAAPEPPAHYVGGKDGARWDNERASAGNGAAVEDEVAEGGDEVAEGGEEVAEGGDEVAAAAAAAAASSGKPPKRNKGGHSLVGMRLQVWWEGDQCWYKGRIEVSPLPSSLSLRARTHPVHMYARSLIHHTHLAEVRGADR